MFWAETQLDYFCPYYCEKPWRGRNVNSTHKCPVSPCLHTEHVCDCRGEKKQTHINKRLECTTLSWWLVTPFPLNCDTFENQVNWWGSLCCQAASKFKGVQQSKKYIYINKEVKKIIKLCPQAEAKETWQSLGTLLHLQVGPGLMHIEMKSWRT